MKRKVERPGVRGGYDLWAQVYDHTPNPLVALDRRHTFEVLRPRPRERILDAGCGTGAHVRAIGKAGGRPVGVDFSRGMLRVAHRANRSVPFVQADLNRGLPLARDVFDALLCALVSEHLTRLAMFFTDAYAVLRDGGRLVFSAFHPEIAASGVEANFESDGTEYRLGAESHTMEDYLGHIEDAGFRDIKWREHAVDSAVVEEIPWAVKYLGRPLLLTIEAERRSASRDTMVLEKVR
jgi:SAM-dependent methyltransferase